MAEQKTEWLTTSSQLTLAELCDHIGAHAEFIEALVKQGVIEPVNTRATIRYAASWRFSKQALDRSRKAVRLTRDLGVNLAGASLAIELLEQLEEARAELERLRRLQGINSGFDN
ncbi:MAG: chaperone modulator CbpM [Pseudomonadales bacterium]